jgi:hypothetical protein
MKEESLSFAYESHPQPSGESLRPRRPFSVTLLAIGVLTLAAAGLVRTRQAIAFWDDLTSLSLSISPLYMAATGLIFGLAGLPIGLGIWRGRPWAPRFTAGYVILVFIYFWLDRFFFVQSEIGQVNTLFAIGITIFILLCMFWILSRQQAKCFFRIYSNISTDPSER